jgi:hypothetical protein
MIFSFDLRTPFFEKIKKEQLRNISLSAPDAKIILSPDLILRRKCCPGKIQLKVNKNKPED